MTWVLLRSLAQISDLVLGTTWRLGPRIEPPGFFIFRVQRQLYVFSVPLQMRIDEVAILKGYYGKLIGYGREIMQRNAQQAGLSLSHSEVRVWLAKLYFYADGERNVRTYGVIRISVVVYERCQVSVSSNSTEYIHIFPLQYAVCSMQNVTLKVRLRILYTEFRMCTETSTNPRRSNRPGRLAQ